MARRILVVDDNTDGAESLAMLLQLAGHEATTVNSGPAALDAVRTFTPDVIFLDIGLPEMDGYEVARRLRRDPQFTDLVLVALTGWGSEEDKRRSSEAGFNFHLTKPVEAGIVEELLAGLA
jgi:CheY-like chemotaxis protein